MSEMSNPTDKLIGGIILAAGESTRYGTKNKLLTPVSETPMIRAVATTAVEALDTVMAVVGHEDAAVSASINDIVDGCRYNAQYTTGQSTSVRLGATVASERGWDAAVFCLGDMPFVSAATITELQKQYRAAVSTIVAPRYEGQRGNPVLFDQQHFDDLLNLTGDTGGRNLIQDNRETAIIETNDSGVVRDIDTVADSKQYLSS